jgi:hypothetical protein
MVVLRSASIRTAAAALTAFAAIVTPMGAGDSLGTFRWQLQPFCNIVTLSVRLEGGIYTLDGFDDQCGIGDRASVVGTAFPHPDGSLGFGWLSVIAPDAAPLAVHARLDLATVNGLWSDSAGNSGALSFTPGPGTDGPPRPVPSNGLRPASITGEQLTPAAVGSTHIAERAVQAKHLAPGALGSALGSISSAQIGAGAITAAHLAPGVIDSAAIRDGAVGSLQIAPGAVTATHFAPGAVNAALGQVSSAQIALAAILSHHIVPGAVTAAHLAPGVIGGAAIAAGAVQASHVATGAVGAAQIAAGAVGVSHLEPGIVQSLIVGTCRAGTYLRGVTSSGAVICEPFFVPPRSTVVAIAGSPLGTTIAVDADSVPVIASYDQAARTLRVTKCLNPSCSGGQVTSLPDPPGTSAGDNPAIVIGSDGFPLIAHGDWTTGTLRVTKCGNPACTSGNNSTIADAAQSSGFKPSVAFGSDGLPVISHSAGSGLRVTKCGDPACSTGNVSTNLTPESVAFESALAIGADGLPVIGYETAIEGHAGVRVIKCGNAACSTGNVITTVDDPRPFQAGEGIAIAIGADGFPVLAYKEITRSRLRVVKCGNQACTAGNVLSIVDDANGMTAAYLSLVIGMDGLPTISTQIPRSGVLRVVKCGNPACSAGNVSTAVDGSDQIVGFYNQMSIGRDGVAVIGHVAMGGTFRVTKCGSQSCR